MNDEKEIKSITIFTYGDSNKLKTWSNVPYYLSHTFEEKGFIVNRVNVEFRIIGILYNRTIAKLIRVFYKGQSEHSFERARIYDFLVEQKMKAVVKKYKDTDVFISTSFSFSPWKHTNKKTIMFCDWTIDYLFKYFLDREPNPHELDSIMRQKDYIENTDYVVSLFPDITNYMKTVYKNQNIFYLGNVINSKLNLEVDSLLACKSTSQSILFIGGKKYREGAECLINAFRNLKNNFPDLQLNIIGMTEDLFSHIPTGVNFYGYLNKSDEKDNELYYKLMAEAKVVVNTTPKWGAFSSTVEAMYWYTPVITTPYDSFVETFGKNIDFGYYCVENEVSKLGKFLIDIFELASADYLQLCKNANKNVKDFTWDKFVDEMLKILD